MAANPRFPEVAFVESMDSCFIVLNRHGPVGNEKTASLTRAQVPVHIDNP
jgi:hypothetical protein